MSVRLRCMTNSFVDSFFAASLSMRMSSGKRRLPVSGSVRVCRFCAISLFFQPC